MEKRIRRKTGFIAKLLNVVLGGANAVGKSTLLNAAKGNITSHADVNMPVTVKLPSPTRTDKSAECTIVEITDSAVREFPMAAAAFKHEAEGLWTRADVAVLVMSCTRRKSLEHALHLYDTRIKTLPNAAEIPIILVLTHTDAIPEGHVLSLMHHVQPIARAMPTVGIFTTPRPQSQHDVEPLFAFINRVARNPSRAFAEKMGEFPVYHLRPSPNCVGQWLMMQTTGQSELKSNAQTQGEDWDAVVARLIEIVGVTALREMGWDVDEAPQLIIPQDSYSRASSVDLSPQDLDHVLSDLKHSPKWAATAISNPATTALERWTSLFDLNPSPTPSNRASTPSRPDSPT